MSLGINTFGLSKLLKKDRGGTLAALKDFGIDQIELCVVFSSAFGPMKRFLFRFGFAVVGLDGGNLFGKDADRFMKDATASGFSVRSVHCALCNSGASTLEGMIGPAREFASRYGIKYFVTSLMTDSVKKTEKYLPSLKIFVAAMNVAGVEVLYHNHDGELLGESGATPLDHILREVPALGLELDVGWAKYAGSDPVELMKKYAERVKIVHLKDVKENASGRKKCFTAIGEGGVPLREVIAEGKKLCRGDAGFVLDQDDSEGDLLRDIRVGAENVRKYL